MNPYHRFCKKCGRLFATYNKAHGYRTCPDCYGSNKKHTSFFDKMSKKYNSKGKFGVINDE